MPTFHRSRTPSDPVPLADTHACAFHPDCPPKAATRVSSALIAASGILVIVQAVVIRHSGPPEHSVLYFLRSPNLRLG